MGGIYHFGRRQPHGQPAGKNGRDKAQESEVLGSREPKAGDVAAACVRNITRSVPAVMQPIAAITTETNCSRLPAEPAITIITGPGNIDETGGRPYGWSVRFIIIR